MQSRNGGYNFLKNFDTVNRWSFEEEGIFAYSNFDPECPVKLEVELSGDIVPGEGVVIWTGNGAEVSTPLWTDFLFLHHWTAKLWNHSRQSWGLRTSRAIFTYRKTTFVMLQGDNPAEDEWLVEIFKEVAEQVSDKIELYVLRTNLN